MFHTQKLLVLMAVTIVGSVIMSYQSMSYQSIGTYVALASDSSIYGSGFSQGCDDAGIFGPDKRSINRPERNLSFTSDEFTKGYAAGSDVCSENRDLEFLGWNI